MQSHLSSFTFSPNFNFGNQNLFIQQFDFGEGMFPPTPGDFRLLNGTDFLLLTGGNFLLL